MNALVGSQNIEDDFEKILARYPECLQAVPILLAVREREIFCADVNYRFDKKVQSVAEYKNFMRQTGLFDLLENHIVANLFDYVTGVEYFKEIYLADVEKIFGLDLSAISAQGTATKRFDFVVRTAAAGNLRGGI